MECLLRQRTFGFPASMVYFSGAKHIRTTANKLPLSTPTSDEALLACSLLDLLSDSKLSAPDGLRPSD
jgi:hypothetical protein